jgi:hypothetical protein
LFLVFCFHNRALWHGAKQKPTLFLPKTPSAYGMAVDSTLLTRLVNPSLRIEVTKSQGKQRLRPIGQHLGP